MTQYIRRPFMVGNTAVDLHAQPFITGTLTELDLSEVDPSAPVLQLRVETFEGTSEFTFARTSSISQIVTAINAAATDVTALSVDGVLRLGVTSSAPGAYICIRETTETPNAAPCLGFRVYPHPMALVSNGDLVPAPVRTDVEGNPAGTLFLARGEDRLAKNFNRILHQIAINADTHEFQLAEEVAEPKLIAFAPEDERLVIDATTGNILGVNLPPEDYVYVGGSSNTSSLSEIARSFIVSDLEGNRINVWVSAVTRGSRSSFPGTPFFTTTTESPVGPLADTSSITLDGGNALGVQRLKGVAGAITDIQDATILICSTASFLSNGVVHGDIVDITLGPLANRGLWVVERVISETELEVRPASGARMLTVGEGTDLGSLTVRSNGKFERDIQISFTPPISRVGSGFIVGYGIAKPRGHVSTDADLFGLAFNRRTLPDTWDSVYNGPANNGGGSFARVTGHPFTAQLSHDGLISAGTLNRSMSAAEISADNILTAPTNGFFSDTDLGRVVHLVIGSETKLATIVELVDLASVRLLPYEDSELAPATGVSVSIYDGAFHDFPGSVTVTTNELFDADAGFVVIGEGESATTGFGFTNLRRIHTYGSTNIRSLQATASAATLTVATLLPEAPRFTAGTIVRILTGDNAGFYRCVNWSTSGANTLIEVETLAGESPLPPLSGNTRIALYTATFATERSDKPAATQLMSGMHVDWALIGTSLNISDYLPLVATSELPSIDRTSYRPQLLSAVEASTKEVGAGIGLSKTLADMPSLNAVFTDFYYSTGTHTVDGEAKQVYNGWSTDNKEPRTPFPNSAIISRDLNLESGVANLDIPAIEPGWYDGSIRSDDFTVSEVTRVTAAGTRIYFSSEYGGCLRLSSTQDGTTSEVGIADTIRLSLKPLPAIPQNKFGYKVRIKTQAYLRLPIPPPPAPPPETAPCIVALRRADGSLLASGTVDLEFETGVSNTVPHEYEVILVSTAVTAGTIIDSPADELITDARITLDFKIAGSQVYSVGITPVAPGIIHLLECKVTSLVQPLRVDAPLYVGSNVSAASYRLVPAVHGYQTVGPAEVSLLSGQDYGDNIGVTQYGQQEGSYGVGLLRQNAADSFGWYYQPVYQIDQFFKKTPHSAAIVGYHPYFDPLFYAIANGVASSLRADVLPGKTGFIIPLNPPHGATLTSLAFNLSFLPSEHWTDSSDVTSDFQVWSDIPSSLAIFSPDTLSTRLLNAADSAEWRDPAIWRARKGFMIKLWRYNALNFGTNAPESATYTGMRTSVAGFGEVIWQRRMPLPPTGELSSFQNMNSSSYDAPYTNAPLGREYVVSEVIGLDTSGDSKTPATREEALIVDRRHYAYFMTIEFYIGRRELAGSPSAYTYHSKGMALEDSYIPKLETFNKIELTGGWVDLPAQVLSARFPLVAYDNSPYDEVGGGDGENWKPRPPVVKFRGARLGWLTDRPGHGGWGG